MANFMSFAKAALNLASSIYNALGDNCTFTLSGGGDSVTFPVTPGSFEVSDTFNNQTLTINSIGEINMLGKRGLKTIKFDAFFPNQYYDFANSIETSPYSYVDNVERMATSGIPLRIVITGTGISTACTIDDFSYREKDGTGDVYFSITLKEYRYIRPDADKADDTTGLKGRTEEAVSTKTTTAYSTDSMEVAHKALQKLKKAQTIADAGRRQIDIYKALVKSGGVSPGTLITVTADSVLKDGKLIQSSKEA